MCTSAALTVNGASEITGSGNNQAIWIGHEVKLNYQGVGRPRRDRSWSAITALADKAHSARKTIGAKGLLDVVDDP